MALATQTTKAQTGVPDTLAYLQYIVANKSKFIGKPFSVLRDSLKIKIKLFSPFAGIPQNMHKETSTSFAFYFRQSTADYYLSFPRLRVFWQPYLNATQSDQLFETLNGAWVSPAISFYANAIVADINILE
jgi:hypothetical protein